MLKEKLFSIQKLIRLIIPLVIEQGLTILVGMADGVMVSSVGEAAISGVSLVDMINAVILVLFAALATGGAVVTSQFLGARNLEKAQKSAGQLVLMSIGLGVLTMIPCLIFDEELLMLCFGAIEADVKAAGLKYLRITALSFPFIALYNAGAAIYRSVGNSKVSMKVSMLMNIINVAGNAFCIFVLKWGVYGVAVPTLVSRAVAGIYMMVLVAKPEQELSLTREGLTSIDKKMMASILRIGVPSACENCFFSLGRLIVASMITLFGTTQVSANAVAGNIDRLGIILGQAMGLAMVTVVGQCIGARDTDQATYYIKKMLRWTFLAQGLSNVLILVFMDQLVGFYGALSGQTRELAMQLSTIHASLAIVFWPVSFVLPNALRAANDVKFTMWVGIGSMLACRIFGSWLLCVHFGMGALGVWIAMVSDWVCRTAFFVPRTVRGKWKTMYKPD
ncbi:MAG: MATE family efflux transporter [Oscillospiraceae bacterium]|nr:MATE family efflux transporter [Oscillospiraceae bacterium]MBR3973765.1 MATE family efflux transporter [Oscillospiraceae bacterium]